MATVYPTNGGLYVLGGVYTANSSDTGATVDEVFDTGELFYQLEVGWSALARTGRAGAGPRADGLATTST